MAGGNLQQQYENIHAWAMDATLHWDALPAWNIYRELEKFLAELPAEQKQEPELAKEIATLKQGLLIVGFPALPREEAVKLFREHVLDFFRVDVDFRERLLARYAFVGYGEKEEEQKRLQEALLQNQERLGQFTLGEWIKLFEQRFKLETRDKKAVATFLVQTGEVASLGKSEQSILRQILSIYDQYIAHEVLDEFDMAVIGNDTNQEKPSQHVSGQTVSSSDRSSQKKITNLPLLQALSKYENLGNQLITKERIKVKSQSEPVRPSLLYWLKYYRDELGIGQHNSVERGDFLFRSENGRKLTASERECMSLILKSVEENFPLSIDLKRQEIIFPIFHDVVVPARPREVSVKQAYKDSAPVLAPASKVTLAPAPREFRQDKPASLPVPKAQALGTPVFFVPKAEEGESVGTGEVSFSAGHIFPAEKEATEMRMAAEQSESVPTPAPVSKPVSEPVIQPRPVPQKINSFRISPVSLSGKNWKGSDE